MCHSVLIITFLPPGIQAKGGTEDTLPWISLAGSFFSVLTGVAILGLEIIVIRLKLAEVKAKGG